MEAQPNAFGISSTQNLKSFKRPWLGLPWPWQLLSAKSRALTNTNGVPSTTTSVSEMVSPVVIVVFVKSPQHWPVLCVQPSPSGALSTPHDDANSSPAGASVSLTSAWRWPGRLPGASPWLAAAYLDGGSMLGLNTVGPVGARIPFGTRFPNASKSEKPKKAPHFNPAMQAKKEALCWRHKCL